MPLFFRANRSFFNKQKKRISLLKSQKVCFTVHISPVFSFPTLKKSESLFHKERIALGFEKVKRAIRSFCSSRSFKKSDKSERVKSKRARSERANSQPCCGAIIIFQSVSETNLTLEPCRQGKIRVTTI